MAGATAASAGAALGWAAVKTMLPKKASASDLEATGSDAIAVQKLGHPSAEAPAKLAATAVVVPGKGATTDTVKWAVLAFLVLQNSSASLLMRGSREAGKWNPQTAVILQEAIKGVLCVGLILRDGGVDALRSAVTPSTEALKTSVPALLYLFQNNMQYVAVGYLDAATYAVLYQFKILTAALMSVVILRRTLSLAQWLALTILTVGASIVIVSQMSGSSKSAGEENSVIIGVVAVLMACLASGLAGVYFEKLLKGSTMSLWARNLQLAAYSLIVGFGGLYQSGGVELMGPEFFRGYTPVVWAAVINNALGGLLIAIVIKFADTILKNFSTTLSILVTTGASVLMFGHAVNPMSIFGTALVIYAVFLYGGMAGMSTLRWLAESAKAIAVRQRLGFFGEEESKEEVPADAESKAPVFRRRAERGGA